MTMVVQTANNQVTDFIFQVQSETRLSFAFTAAVAVQWCRFSFLKRSMSQTMWRKFSGLSDLRAFISSIQQNNHTTSGNWTAGQNFSHLAGAFEGSLEGLPSGYPTVVRMVIRPFRRILTSYRFPPWIPIPSAIKHKLEPSGDADFEVEKIRLLDAMSAFESHTEDHPPHPVIGALSRAEWIGFHLRHCEHHLSFIQLTNESD